MPKIKLSGEITFENARFNRLVVSLPVTCEESGCQEPVVIKRECLQGDSGLILKALPHLQQINGKCLNGHTYFFTPAEQAAAIPILEELIKNNGLAPRKIGFSPVSNPEPPG